MDRKINNKGKVYESYIAMGFNKTQASILLMQFVNKI